MKGPEARRDDPLLQLDEVERRLKPFGRRYVGVREIPLDALVGTDGRASAFTRDFRPLHAFSRDRLRSLESAFADGGFPPIVAVKLGETYFVIDGHRRGGAEVIDADVTELVARVPLPAGAGMLEVVLRARADLPQGQRARGSAPRRSRPGQQAGALPRATGERPDPRRPLPRSPSAPAGCISLDRLSAPCADGRVGDRRQRSAPPAAAPGPRAPI